MDESTQKLFLKYHLHSRGRKYNFDNIFVPELKLPNVDVYQVGELIVDGEYGISEHTQLCNEISYVIAGKCEFYTNGKVVQASQGDVHIVAKGMRHIEL